MEQSQQVLDEMDFGPILLLGREPNKQRGRQSIQNLTRFNSQAHSGCWPTRRPLIVSILLPLMLLFLLPSLRLIQESYRSTISEPESHQSASSSAASSLSQLALNHANLLLRLPIERLRFSSLGLISGTEASFYHPPSERQDLLEEESHLLMQGGAQSGQYTAGSAHGHRHQPQLSQARSQHQHQNQLVAEPSIVNPVEALHSGGGSLADQLDASGYPPPTDGSGLQTGQGESGSGEQSTAMSGGVRTTSSISQTRNDLPAVRALNVKCERQHMTVNIVFDRPFYGMVFSKGHYNDQKCIHLPANSGQTSVNFDIHLNKCGMSGTIEPAAMIGPNGVTQRELRDQTTGGQQQPQGLFIENTIIIQYDPQVQEIYDQARKLRCTWYDYYEKSVTFRPYNVDMMDAVTANFLGDNIQCWMQIQVGKGPWSSEVAGIVKIGQTMTMVLAIKDDENKFDMLVRNCVAHDGRHQPIQLVDEYGCVARPKIMGKFQKVRNFGPTATVVSFAHFQAFKFPDSMSVHFQCVIQVCRHDCPEPVCPAGAGGQSLDPPSSTYQSGQGPQGSVASVGLQGGSDYAAAGTEIVASKEPLPSSQLYPRLASNGSIVSVPHESLHSTSSGQSRHQIKLNESQGRVQVKLDTSMLASPGGFALPRGHQHNVDSHSLQVSAPMTGSRASLLPGSRNSHPQLVSGSLNPSNHYSMPFGSTQRSANYATNRLGELAPSPAARIEPEPTGSALSFIAKPRALKAPEHTTSSDGHLLMARQPRSKRNVADEIRHKHQRVARNPESTNVNTHKTIQVVSPDDVAFSLIGSDELTPEIVDGSGRQASRDGGFRSSSKQQVHIQTDQSTVCFSAVQFVAATFVSLALLVGSLVIAVYLMLKQRRSTLIYGQKRHLATFRDPAAEGQFPALSAQYPDVSGCSYAPDGTAKYPSHQSYMESMSNQQQNNSTGANQFCLSRHLEPSRASELHSSHSKNKHNYLNRLYTQFTPANFNWR